MDHLSLIREILSGGSDLATILLFLLMWRFDRRLLVLETRALIKTWRQKQND